MGGGGAAAVTCLCSWFFLLLITIIFFPFLKSASGSVLLQQISSQRGAILVLFSTRAHGIPSQIKTIVGLLRSEKFSDCKHVCELALPTEFLGCGNEGVENSNYMFPWRPKRDSWGTRSLLPASNMKSWFLKVSNDSVTTVLPVQIRSTVFLSVYSVRQLNARYNPVVPPPSPYPSPPAHGMYLSLIILLLIITVIFKRLSLKASADK